MRFPDVGTEFMWTYIGENNIRLSNKLQWDNFFFDQVIIYKENLYLKVMKLLDIICYIIYN